MTLELLDSLWKHEPIRMLSVGLTSFCDNRISQMNIFQQEINDTKTEKLEKVMDEIRNKFGNDSIKYARNKK